MSDVTTTNISAAPETGNLKRSIMMKHFTDAKIKAKVISENVEVPCGQIIGQIFSVGEREFTDKMGRVNSAMYALGEFEASVYATGEVFESATAYLPVYYLEAVKSILEKDKSNSGVVFSLEVVCVPTGKTIPFAYEVKNLIRRRSNNPLNAIKEEMQRAGRLRLPPPVQREAGFIEGEATDLSENVTDEATPVITDDAKPARGAKKAA